MTIEELKKRKKELGLTYEEIAVMSCVPLATVQKVLGGFTKSPRFETIEALLRVLKPEEAAAGFDSADHSARRGTQSEENADHSGALYCVPASASEPAPLRETPAGYAAYIYGSSAHKGYEDSYPLLPYKRQGEYTAADRDSLPADVRTELIDGVLYDMSSPKHVHQLLLGEIYTALRNCIEENDKDCIVFMAPSDVWLDGTDKTIVQPDIYVLCDLGMMGKDGFTHGAPPFAVEILSSSTAVRDRGIKLAKYLTSGVREYWIVDPDKRKILVYRFDEAPEDALDPKIYSFEDTVPVGISGGTCCVGFRKVNELLNRIGL